MTEINVSHTSNLITANQAISVARCWNHPQQPADSVYLGSVLVIGVTTLIQEAHIISPDDFPE